MVNGMQGSASSMTSQMMSRINGNGLGGQSFERKFDQALQKFDTDGNSEISAAEFEESGRPSKLFSMLDADGNGSLTESEAAAGAEAMKDKMAKMMQSLGGVSSMMGLSGSSNTPEAGMHRTLMDVMKEIEDENEEDGVYGSYSVSGNAIQTNSLTTAPSQFDLIG